MQVGKRIERAQHLVVVLDAALSQRLGEQVGPTVLESVLIAEESIITYRRRYASRPRSRRRSRLLVSDRTNPRSLAYQLQHLELDLRTSRPAAGRADLRRAPDARRAARRDRRRHAVTHRRRPPGAGRRRSWHGRPGLRRLADEVLAMHGTSAAPLRGLDFSLPGGGR